MREMTHTAPVFPLLAQLMGIEFIRTAHTHSERIKSQEEKKLPERQSANTALFFLGPIIIIQATGRASP